jgi:hypothetical protein
MKKFAFALAAVALTGAMAFAEDAAVKLTGYVDSGAKVVAGKGGASFTNYALDWGDAGTWATLTAKYDGAKSGFKVVVDVTTKPQTVSTTTLGAYVVPDTAYAYLVPVTGLNLIGGKGYTGVFDGIDDESDDAFSSTGLSAVYSISGVTFGAGAALNSDASSDTSADTVLGLAYTLEKVADFRASLQLVGADGLPGSYAVSASFVGVPNLTLTAGTFGYGVGHASTQKINADLTVGYAQDALFGQVVGYYLAANDKFVATTDDTWTGKNAFNFAPRIGYKLTPDVKVYVQDNFKFVDSAYTTQVLRLNVGYSADALGSITARGEYDVKAETTTVYLDYLVTF